MTHTAAEIARVCHEANRALQIIQADPGIAVSEPWLDLDEESRRSIIFGVEGVLAGNDPEESHQAWVEFKLAHGWTLGDVKDLEAKTHPLLVPYDQLPEAARKKDELFIAIVAVLGDLL